MVITSFICFFCCFSFVLFLTHSDYVLYCFLSYYFLLLPPLCSLHICCVFFSFLIKLLLLAAFQYITLCCLFSLFSIQFFFNSTSLVCETKWKWFEHRKPTQQILSFSEYESFPSMSAQHIQAEGEWNVSTKYPENRDAIFLSDRLSPLASRPWLWGREGLTKDDSFFFSIDKSTDPKHTHPFYPVKIHPLSVWKIPFSNCLPFCLFQRFRWWVVQIGLVPTIMIEFNANYLFHPIVNCWTKTYGKKHVLLCDPKSRLDQNPKYSWISRTYIHDESDLVHLA